MLFTPPSLPVKKTLPLLDDFCATALLERLADIKRPSFERALWVGGGDAQALCALKTIGHLDVRHVGVEGETEHFPHEAASLDLVVFNGTLHRVNDLPGVLVQIRRALKPDGLFLCALTGGETLHELRDCLTRAEMALHNGGAARIHPMIDLPTLAGLMQRAGFALPVTDTEIKTIFYKKMNSLLKDIKASGEGNILTQKSKRYVGRAFWPSVEAAYKTHHADPDGLLRASVEILYAIGWGPADTQPQPLKPGQAKNRLADALGATEGSLPR